MIGKKDKINIILFIMLPFILLHHFTTIINSAPFAEQGILRLS